MINDISLGIIIKDIANKYTFHRRGCIFDVAPGDEGDFCSCNITGRMENLEKDIWKVVKNVAS